MEVKCECSICGAEFRKVDMIGVSKGRSTHYMCIRCYEKGINLGVGETARCKNEREAKELRKSRNRRKL